MSFLTLKPDDAILYTPAIWHPDAPRDGWSVVLFRRSFAVGRATPRVELRLSASERFIVFLDGQVIARGPVRSDPSRWGVARVKLPRLSAGGHALTVCVAHFGQDAGMGQMGGPAFFLLHGVGKAGKSLGLDTGEAWRCSRDESRAAIRKHEWGGKTPYYVVGAGERIDAGKAHRGWEAVDFDDSAWPPAKVVCAAAGNPWGNRPLHHELHDEQMPAMEHMPGRMRRVAEAPQDLIDAASAWIAGKAPLCIEPGREVRLVLDRGEPTNAYVRLTTTAGAGATVRMVSAESPYTGQGKAKGNRDETAGKLMWGHVDEFLPDGSGGFGFEPLWFRSFRYLELKIRTQKEPLKLDAIALSETAYPLRMVAKFATTQGGEAPAADGATTPDSLALMWEVSFRTARLCAHETFFDCPHYEQCQFPGDSRIQAIYHYLIANDDRLARKCIDDMHASRLSDGLLQCRFPSRAVQVISTFSLYWIGMLRDFYLYRGDGEFLRPYLPAARGILAWFEARRRADGMLGLIPHAPFIDWAKAFEAGNAPQDREGGSSILTLLLAETCGWMAELERACGYRELAPRWQGLGRSLAKAAKAACWDSGRGLMSDTAGKRTFSVHAQVQAILASAQPIGTGRAALLRALAEPGQVTQPNTLYFRYYVAQALKRVGERDAIATLLPAWQRCLAGTGLRTWPESDVEPRSDCHAWSVTPGIEMVQTILGVEPAGPGFAVARINPAAWGLGSASGSVATPGGRIGIKWVREGQHMRLSVDSAVPFVVGTQTRVRPAGKHAIRL